MIHIRTTDTPTTVNNDRGWTTIEFDDDNLNLTAELNTEPGCTHCHEPIAEYTGGWHHDHNSSRYCNEHHDPEELAPGELEGLGYSDVDEYLEDVDTATPGFRHHAQAVGFELAPSGEVRAQITTGDPRGCLQMVVWSYIDDEGNERLRLRVPHPDDAEPHARLTEVYPGTYELN